MGATITIVVAAVVLACLFVWERFVSWPRVEEALRRVDDARLEELWLRAPLDGRQRRWVREERERRGLA